MEHRSFSARFRRNGRKGNHNTTITTSSPGQSPGATTTTTTNNDASDHSPSPTAPPVLTITTTDSRPKTSHTDSHSIFKPPKSPFGSSFGKFHLHRSSNKRARSPAPAALPQPVSPAAVKQDGLIDHEMMSPERKSALTRSAGAQDEPQQQGSDARGQPSPKIPAFLNLSEQDILAKYVEITWNERKRIFQGATSTSPASKFARVDSAFRILDRYGNIQPWNNNRVKLQVPEGAPDYINASPIVLHSPLDPENRPPHRYIAMQGPTERTSEHVWRMVAEQLASPAVMVMLTETHENNVEKCYPYYPHKVDETVEIGEGDEFQDGWRAQVTCVDIEERAEGAIEMRKLQFHVEGKDQDTEVWHLLYKKWPDFGVPALEDIDSFLELMSLSRDKNASDDNPRIVHCSAGVGRSGTFIALEHLMREIDSGDLGNYDGNRGGNDADLVFDTVNALREQRKMMVQAEPQYLFIYQVLRKQWMEKYNIEDDQGGEPAAKRLETASDPFVEND